MPLVGNGESAIHAGYATEVTGLVKVTDSKPEPVGKLVLRTNMNRQTFNLEEVIPISGEVYYGEEPLQTQVNIKIDSGSKLQEFVTETNPSGYYFLAYKPEEPGNYMIVTQVVKEGDIMTANQAVTSIEVLGKEGLDEPPELSPIIETSLYTWIFVDG